jgi:quercetin dioxygenase-like cupin family protein
MEPTLVVLDVGGMTAMEKPHPGEEFGYVMMGQITLIYGKKRFVVKKDETFYFYSNKDHYIMNSGSGKAKILWVSTPPMF